MKVAVTLFIYFYDLCFQNRRTRLETIDAEVCTRFKYYFIPQYGAKYSKKKITHNTVV